MILWWPTLPCRGVVGAGAPAVSAPPFQHQCTLEHARQTWPGLPNHQLSTLAVHLGIDLNHHHAQSDAIAAGRVMLAAKQQQLSKIEAPHLSSCSMKQSTTI